MGCDAVLLGE